MALINFVRNHNDLSTDSGFQFEFCCDRCGNGYQSTFEPSVIGGVADVLNAAGNLLGGMFSNAASLGESARSATWEKAHDEAFCKAVAEAKPHFRQCSRCGQWMDGVCWNGDRGMCKECAPDLDEEYTRIQTQAAIEQAAEAAREVTHVTKKKFEKPLTVVTCAECGVALRGGKFCHECGTAVIQSHDCTDCGADTGGKFCPECGTKQ